MPLCKIEAKWTLRILNEISLDFLLVFSFKTESQRLRYKDLNLGES
jgi:hypothetical protein